MIFIRRIYDFIYLKNAKTAANTELQEIPALQLKRNVVA
jgi:hypothetical protein